MALCYFLALLIIHVPDYKNNNNDLYSQKQLHVHGTYKAVSTKLYYSIFCI